MHDRISFPSTAPDLYRLSPTVNTRPCAEDLYEHRATIGPRHKAEDCMTTGGLDLDQCRMATVRFTDQPRLTGGNRPSGF